ncbi:MAG: class I SAM-dependent RNA methyltransferase [Smithellaceae bacterium]
MQIKDRMTVRIESIAFGGEGVARADSFVLFVPFTAPGDVAHVEIVSLKKRFGRARLISLQEPSALRVTPQCSAYGLCGGCCYQHIDYDQQLIIKKNQIRDAFVKIGRMPDPPAGDVIPSPLPYAYRGKAVLHTGKKNASSLGFMDISGGRLANIRRCEIMDETINDQIRAFRQGLSDWPADADITFWSGEGDAKDGPVVRAVSGREFLIPRDGFFQANLFLTDRMVAEVVRLVSGKKIDTLVDACCGSGLFSVFLAPYARRVIGIEIHEKSVKYARLNAERQGMGNIEFLCGDVEDIFCRMAQKKEAVDLILLDPPRAGLSPEVLFAIRDVRASGIIYISCNPATQARDVRFLNDAGYDLESLVPLDMFPQTQHIELIGYLERRRM